MGLIQKPDFSAGEIDPALWERTNLEKYRAGLSTARNWSISKTGSILTRQSRAYGWTTKFTDQNVILYAPPGGGVMLEWGNLYVRIYDIENGYPFTLLADLAHPYTTAMLPYVNFSTGGSYVYVFCLGQNLLQLNYATYAFTAQGSIFTTPAAPTAGTLTSSGSPSGYACVYAITYVVNGEESAPYFISGTADLPEEPGQSVTVASSNLANVTNVDTQIVSQMNVYRAPSGNGALSAGAYGYVGTSTNLIFSGRGGTVTSSFVDIGADADFTQQPPETIMPAITNGNAALSSTDPGQLLSPTGMIYQQRLLLADGVLDLEAIYASMVGFPNDFRQDFPIDDISALKFKCGTSGYAKVLRMLDSDGLVVFTSAGIYLNQGVLEPDNLAFAKKGKWIINSLIPPLDLPGGTVFVDSMTNGVRNLLWSFVLNAYDAQEVSIFSNHLFRSRTINSWNFQQGYFPLLWVAFADGGMATFTYDYNQQMQAWTRHDSAWPISWCTGTVYADMAFFVVNKTDPNSGQVVQTVEYSLPRYPAPSVVTGDPNWQLGQYCAFMDSITTFTNNIAPLGTTPFTFATTLKTNVNSGGWDGVLNLTCSGLKLFTDYVVGDIIRMFDEDKSVIDVEVVTASVDGGNTIQVEAYNVEFFPGEKWATGATLYWTTNQLTGMNYLNLENVAVIADGAVMASPNNDVDGYPTLQVSQAGVLNLPSLAAIIHVGRPIVADVAPLPIDTVEQKPTLIESLVVNKVYVKVKDSQGLFVGPKFPKNNGVKGMVAIDKLAVDYGSKHPIIGNRAAPDTTQRYEVITRGDYSQQGIFAVRQVDPLHAEILSFIPDVEVQYRRGD